tara:strand:- start:791 stop:1438 length:648 start_codon:yes stop_codon:yes gene_type:complete
LNPKELNILARQGEGQSLEFKKKANHPDKIVRELVAFANSAGGVLLLGVDDDGTLSGTRDIEGEAFVIEKAIKELIRPQLPYEVSLVALTEKKGVAVFKIPESRKKPHFVREHPGTRKGVAYVRVKDESIKASREMREIMQRRLRNKDIQFTYGEQEKVLLNYLAEHEHVSLIDFVRLVRVPKFVASRTLVRLVLANVIDIVPTPKGDIYMAKTT